MRAGNYTNIQCTTWHNSTAGNRSATTKISKTRNVGSARWLVVGKTLAAKPNGLSLLPGTRIVKAKNQLSQVTYMPNAQTKYCNNNNNNNRSGCAETPDTHLAEHRPFITPLLKERGRVGNPHPLAISLLPAILPCHRGSSSFQAQHGPPRFVAQPQDQCEQILTKPQTRQWLAWSSQLQVIRSRSPSPKSCRIVYLCWGKTVARAINHCPAGWLH